MGNINSCWAGGEEPAETSSRCVTPATTGAHNFAVENYSRLNGRGRGKFVSSRPFRVGGHTWNIRFYPDGLSPRSPYFGVAGHAAAYLCLLSRVPAAGVHTKFTLSLVVKDGKSHRESTRSGECKTHTFPSGGDRSWGFADFVDMSTLHHQDSLTIRCDLTVMKEPKIHSVEDRAGAYGTAKMC